LANLAIRRKAAPRLAERGDIHFLGASLWKSLGQATQVIDYQGFFENDATWAAACPWHRLHGYPHFLGASLWKSAG
jgi:hypothetical protein